MTRIVQHHGMILLNDEMKNRTEGSRIERSNITKVQICEDSLKSRGKHGSYTSYSIYIFHSIASVNRSRHRQHCEQTTQSYAQKVQTGQSRERDVNTNRTQSNK